MAARTAYDDETDVSATVGSGTDPLNCKCPSNAHAKCSDRCQGCRRYRRRLNLFRCSSRKARWRCQAPTTQKVQTLCETPRRPNCWVFLNQLMASLPLFSLSLSHSVVRFLLCCCAPWLCVSLAFLCRRFRCRCGCLSVCWSSFVSVSSCLCGPCFVRVLGLFFLVSLDPSRSFRPLLSSCQVHSVRRRVVVRLVITMMMKVLVQGFFKFLACLTWELLHHGWWH